MITDADMSRLSNEIAFSTMGSWEWVDSKNIDREAMDSVLNSASDVLKNLVEEMIEINEEIELPHIQGIVADIAGNAFRLGWEAHAQFST